MHTPIETVCSGSGMFRLGDLSCRASSKALTYIHETYIHMYIHTRNLHTCTYIHETYIHVHTYTKPTYTCTSMRTSVQAYPPQGTLSLGSGICHGLHHQQLCAHIQSLHAYMHVHLLTSRNSIFRLGDLSCPASSTALTCTKPSWYSGLCSNVFCMYVCIYVCMRV